MRYGLDHKQLRKSRLGPALTTRHRLPMTNLIPGTTYY